MQTRFKNLEIFYSISNPNDAYECFLKVFSGTYDLAFYLKTISFKKNSAKSLVDQRPFRLNDSKNYMKNF